MDEPRTCPSCHQAIPADAPGGACPRCLIGVGLGGGSGATGGGAAVPDVAPDEVRRRFPAYDVVATIGRGGMGVVFRAKQRALDRDVALKVLPASASRPAGFAERFEREAKALARLQHPGIVQVFDFGTSPDGWCFLAMELVEGTNLRRALAGGRLAPKDALAIVPQICDALQYAHDQGVVHRDIKPENVLLAKDGRVKIADFGLAKLVADAGGNADGSWVTRTGLSMGTPLYMAPEQIEHPADVDHRADIYSLGVVFYEMLTGELPLGRFASPSRKCDVDARIDEIVLRTLEKERDARYQRAGDVRTEMAAAAAGETSRIEVGRHVLRPERPWQAALGFLIALAGLATYFAAAVVTHHDWWWALVGAAGGAVVFATAGFRRVERAASPDRPRREASDESAPPARLSRLAVASLFAPVLVVAVMYVAWSANRGSTEFARLSVVRNWAWVAAFCVVATAVLSLVRIVGSRGRLRGSALAVVGAVASVFAALGTYDEIRARGLADESSQRLGQIGALQRDAGDFVPHRAGDSDPNGWPLRSRSGSSPAPATPRIVDGVEIAPGIPDTMVAEAVHGPAIRELFGFAQALWPPKEWEEFEKLYGMGDANVINGLDEKSRAERGAYGVLGLPLATESFLGGSLRSARITKVTVEYGRTRGWVTFECAGKALVADVVREPGNLPAMAWRFSLTPVRKATEQPLLPEDMAPPAPIGGTRR